MKKFELHETKDYGCFKTLHYNRDVDPKKVSSLVESIKKYGLTQPLVVSRDGYVLDGQHRLSALIRLSLPVHYVSIYSYTAEQIAEINNTQKSWNLVDYIKSSASRGNLDCKSLLEVFEDYPEVSPSVLAKLFSDDGNRGVSAIRTGKYRFNRDRGQNIMTMLETLEDFLLDRNEDAHRVYGSRFAEAFYKVVVDNDNFDISRLLSSLNSKILRFYDNVSDNVESIVNMYNCNQRGANRIQ